MHGWKALDVRINSMWPWRLFGDFWKAQILLTARDSNEPYISKSVLRIFLTPQGSTGCPNLDLSSLPPPSLSPLLDDLTTSATSLLASLSSLRAHLLFMRMDLQLSPGLPCLGQRQTVTLVTKYKRWAEPCLGQRQTVTLVTNRQLKEQSYKQLGTSSNWATKQTIKQSRQSGWKNISDKFQTNKQEKNGVDNSTERQSNWHLSKTFSRQWRIWLNKCASYSVDNWAEN